MSKRIAIYAHFLAAVVLLASCSTKSAKWANVAYHNTTAHYNIWWNGNESLKEAVELLEKDAADDYTQMLPVAKLGTKEEVMKVYPQLDRAIEKGVKGVKKHSIFLKGKEHVSYIAKCYLLTAYGSFYKKDYVTAINTSRMMISQYRGSEAADEAGIILGRSLAATMQFDEARKVFGVVIPSAPSPSSSAATAMCKPAVALLTLTQYFAPVMRQISCSNLVTVGPCVR